VRKGGSDRVLLVFQGSSKGKGGRVAYETRLEGRRCLWRNGGARGGGALDITGGIKTLSLLKNFGEEGEDGRYIGSKNS